MEIYRKAISDMIGSKSKRYLALIFCICLGIGASIAQQNIFTIRNADSIFAIKKTDSRDYDQVFVGNVFLEEKRKEIKFFCDSAYQHSDTQIIEAFGKVQVNRGDTIDLQGDYMSFDVLKNFLKVRNNAKLEHAKAQLYTDSLDYDMETEIGAYNYGGKLVDSTSVLTSQIGKYYAQTGDAYFEKNVKIEGEDYTITADSIRYNVNSDKAFIIAPTDFHNEKYEMYAEKGVYDAQTGISNLTQATRLTDKNYVLTGDKLNYDDKTGIGILTKNCKLVDSTGNSILRSNYMLSNRSDSSVLVTDSLELEYRMKTDTLFAHSDTIFVHKDSLHNDVLEMYWKVKIFKADLQGKCDSMAFTAADSIMKMFKEPTIWSAGNQLTGDTITAKFVEGKVKYVDLLQNAFLISADDATQSFYNQMKGRKMRGFIEKDTLRNVEVYGNGESLYFAKDKGKYVGMNRIRCSDITIRFKEQKLNTVVFRNKPVGTMYPMEERDKTSLYLSGFRWDESNRPRKREDIFVWNTAVTKT